ncbi:rfaE bifunctional protein nucleotidyltransferase chain/domain [Nocardiopsis sp. Huas11]|uniref:adenylyltransferase/cytidyltransferase family protein n=1 Tax=Nocardiopsis sp. Huas11 TaxID=2183912 RepID=UPI000EB0CB89|nr:adenylyltransferase/cytidyltransferase family protein [Nocardiopsis sp. Huas11]RKS08146.1 rfaE bifunctional protein nucleotidyltransferase chain/domain [Nocardiopsis sp. Huas11]
MRGADGAKPADLEELRRLSERTRAQGRTVALCHGCFDLFHIGHIHHLARAADLADVLVVSVSSDTACAKGPGRPAFPSADRAAVVGALAMVDHVHLARGAGPTDVITALRPDVYVKGHDYARRPCVRLRAETALVERLGGRTVFTDDAVTASSTDLFRRFHA